MPLTWAQVKADLDPKRFTIRTVPALLTRSKAWGGLLRLRAAARAGNQTTWQVKAGGVSVESPFRQHTQFDLEQDHKMNMTYRVGYWRSKPVAASKSVNSPSSARAHFRRGGRGASSSTPRPPTGLVFLRPAGRFLYEMRAGHIDQDLAYFWERRERRLRRVHINEPRQHLRLTRANTRKVSWMRTAASTSAGHRDA